VERGEVSSRRGPQGVRANYPHAVKNQLGAEGCPRRRSRHISQAYKGGREKKGNDLKVLIRGRRRRPLKTGRSLKRQVLEKPAVGKPRENPGQVVDEQRGAGHRKSLGAETI